MFLLKYNLFLLSELINFWTSFIYWSILIVSRESLFYCFPNDVISFRESHYFLWNWHYDLMAGSFLWIDGIIVTIYSSLNALLANYEPIMVNSRRIFGRVFQNDNAPFSWNSIHPNRLLWVWEQVLSTMVLMAELVVVLELLLDHNCFQQGMTYPDVVHEDNQSSTLAN